LEGLKLSSFLPSSEHSDAELLLYDNLILLFFEGGFGGGLFNVTIGDGTASLEARVGVVL
jgi:hypothetical protein